MPKKEDVELIENKKKSRDLESSSRRRARARFSDPLRHDLIRFRIHILETVTIDRKKGGRKEQSGPRRETERDGKKITNRVIEIISYGKEKAERSPRVCERLAFVVVFIARFRG